MTRVLLAIAAVLVGVWLVFTLFRALGAVIHLALVVAVILVALSIVNAIRHRGES